MTANKKKILNKPSSGIFLLVLTCFFLSGFSGLIYEILWTRMMVKIIGSAPFAVSIILSIFMGGLGLGSYLAGRFVDRFQNPLALVKLYGLLELLIAVYALLIPLLLTAFQPLQTMIYNGLYDRFIVYHLATFMISAVILGLPVICMGATLPILCRFYVANLTRLGTHTGRLYGLNTIGAALGSLACGFWLISLWGVSGTLAVAVAINFMIGLICLVFSRKARLRLADKVAQNCNPEKQKLKKQVINHKSHSSFERKAALVIFGISGFCAMASEVIWTRLLGLIVGPTTYSFTIVLVTFITGLALGSLIFGYLADRVKNAFRLLLLTQIAAALLVLGISQLLGGSQLFFAKLIFTFKDQFALQNFLKAALLFGFMILPTLCFGACFPLVGKITTRSVERVGRSIGRAYMVNTVGALLGPICAGFVLIPLVGKESGLSLVVGLQLITCLLTAGVQLAKNKQGLPQFGGLAAPVLAGLVLCFYYPAFNHLQLATGKYHRFETIKTELAGSGWLKSLWRGSKILARSDKRELVYYGDGIGGFTTVTRSADALGNIKYSLANSGKPDASSRGDMATQTLLAHFPMLFQKNPRTVMVIGLASGVTAGEVLWYPVEQLDVLEINDQVAAASNFFSPWNNRVLSDPRTRLILQDARAHLQLTTRNYDVIISEPSNPWMAGLASLFTRDYFSLAKDRLTEEGVFVQWMQAYQMDWKTFAMVGRTFAGVFPNSLLLATKPAGGGADYLLVGFKGQNRLNPADADRKLSYAQKSKNVTLKDPRLLYRLIVSQNLPQLFGTGVIHTDSRPRLEFAAPKLMYGGDQQFQIYRKIRDKRWPSLPMDTIDVIRRVAENTDSQIDFAAYALSLYAPFSGMLDPAQATAGQKKRYFEMMENYCAENELEFSIFTDPELEQRCLAAQIDVITGQMERLPDRLLSCGYLGTLYSLKGDYNESRHYYEKASAPDPLSAQMHNNLGVALIKQGRVDEATRHFSEAVRVDPDYARSHFNLGYVRSRQNRLDEAIDHYTAALRLNPNLAQTHYRLGLALAGRNRLDEAIHRFFEAVRLEPSLADVYNDLGVALAKQGRLDEAIVCYATLLKRKPGFSKAHYNLGLLYSNQGRLDEAIGHFSEALRFNPDYQDAYNAKGVALTRQGRLDEAIRHFHQVLRLNPDFAGAHNNLGIALTRNGMPQDAAGHFKEALRLNPGFASARNNLNKVLALRPD
ncbi:MAG: MFS transporter [bacterium]|nr:MFS transporter [bacterium]